ncbi:MAG: DUF4193 family protein [Actinomycetota bacterium]|nr:DUF4193 family protein [Actinomycetota bacterium]
MPSEMGEDVDVDEELDALGDDGDLDEADLDEDALGDDDIDEDALGDDDLDDALGDDELETPDAEIPVALPPTTEAEETGSDDDDDEEEDDDVEASLDVILKERLVVEDDEEEDEEEEATDAEDRGDGTQRVLPKQPGEFVCQSCFLVKSELQLADRVRMLCRDCV